MNSIQKTFQYGSQQVTIETGRLARQADGAVLVNIDDTIVLVSVVGKINKDGQRDFLPLTVNYQERTYSAGKIPGGFFKREGRPSEKETLISRLIDRPIRPLFPDGFYNDVQVIATVVSLNPDVPSDIPALIGTSAALAISGIPFNGPIAAARVGLCDDHYVLNPTNTELKDSKLDLVVAGTEAAVLMVESEAKELSEAKMLGAVSFGHEQMQTAIRAIKEFASEASKPMWDWTSPEQDASLKQRCEDQFGAEIAEAYLIKEKLLRQDKLSEIRQRAVEQLLDEDSADQQGELLSIIGTLEKKIMRSRILNGDPRIDGRDTRSVRPIFAETGILPRTHGSGVFTRGETQVISVVTLGTSRDAQIIDSIEGEYKDHFMFHYNFPPYCVGETGFMGSPKRREIGHGRLAKRGLLAVIPGEEDFPYVLRVVAEVTESNGSSSMASVCSASLAMMDAGVPIKAAVSGIAMGLVLEDNRFAILSDIMGDEDHFGDMDFKVAGTKDGVTALQMDIKVEGVTPDIMSSALEQAREGRLHILEEMNKALSSPKEMSEYAPRLMTIKIHPDKIRDVIGKGGATIRALTEETGTVIEVDDSGTVLIASTDGAAAEEAKRRIEELTADIEVGKIYQGKVAKIVEFGAFVTVLPGRDGLLHISQIATERVEKVSDYLSEGDEVTVKVLEVDRQGRVRLSKKEVDQANGQESSED